MHIVVTARALLVNPQGELLIVRRSQSDDRHPGTWDIPGGQVEDGETVEAALAREVIEEAGITIRQPHLLFATSNPRPGGSG
jgi:mutator protein MutT